MSIETTIQSPEQQIRSNEIYRYIGLVALAHNRDTNPEYLQQQIVTELAESLDTEMGTHGSAITLYERDGAIIDTDGNNMTNSAVAWAEQQHRRSMHDSRLGWFARFALIEAKEHHDAARFSAHAGIGDTMVVISPFPEEAHANPHTHITVRQEGFRPDIKRSFIRVYEKTEDGIAEHIQSVDESSMSIWNAMFQEQNLPIHKNSEALLSQRFYYKGITGKELAERIAQSYDEALYQQSGVMHRYGKRKHGSPEANLFVRKHAAIVQDTIAELRELRASSSAEIDAQANRILYNSKAFINSLYEQELNGTLVVYNSSSVRSMRSDGGNIAASEGKTFYGCSGESGIANTKGEGSSVSHKESFSMKPGKKVGAYELRDIGSCPVCNTECIQGVYDPNSKKWVSCTVKGCKAYDKQIMNEIGGNGASEARENDTLGWFEEACRFWGIEF